MHSKQRKRIQKRQENGDGIANIKQVLLIFSVFGCKRERKTRIYDCLLLALPDYSFNSTHLSLSSCIVFLCIHSWGWFSWTRENIHVYKVCGSKYVDHKKSKKKHLFRISDDKMVWKIIVHIENSDHTLGFHSSCRLRDFIPWHGSKNRRKGCKI